MQKQVSRMVPLKRGCALSLTSELVPVNPISPKKEVAGNESRVYF